VYAPFGTDEVLSTYPDGTSTTLTQHPLLQSLLRVADSGVRVSALIDRMGDDTVLVDIPPHRPADMQVVSRWKQDMNSPLTLAGLLQHAHQQQPEAAMVLALEGHGAGFLPEIDRRQLSLRNLTGNGTIEWHLSAGQGTPVLPMGSPVLPMGSPVLPMGSPVLPVNHMPLSTWGLGEALRLAQERGAPKLACLHFNNCFNMSVEVLHTVAPHADHATGYLNYNFFTSGASYPAVFQKLQAAGGATAEQIAQWFADENHAALAAKGHHPTVGGVVRLERLHEISERIDDLADALLSALRTASAATRPAIVSRIRHAIVKAQQYDTEGTMELEAPDELTDIGSFAHALLGFDFGPHKVHSAALALREALKGIKRYGDNDIPWVDEQSRWDFSAPTLAMNIFLPDPLLRGLWDWRSPYYLDVNPDPALPRVQPHIIEFLKVTDWVDFIIEYHKETRFVGLLPAAIPEFPVFNAHYEPRKREPDPCNGGGEKGATAG
jgi:hypothetical protein